MSKTTRATPELPEHGRLTQRYADKIVGTLGCWDRVVITGTPTDVCHAGVVEGWLRRDNIRCFDLKVFAEPLRDQVRNHAILTARNAGLTIEIMSAVNGISAAYFNCCFTQGGFRQRSLGYMPTLLVARGA